MDTPEVSRNVSPSRAINNQTIHHACKAFGKNIGELALPPEDEGKIGVQVGENGIAKAPGDTPGEAERNLLTANGLFAMGKVTMSGNPGAQRGLLIASNLHENSAAGVLPSEVVDNA